MNLIGQLKLSSLRKRERRKGKKPKRPMTPPSTPIYTLRVSEREERQKGIEKIFEKNNGWKLPKFDKTTHPRGSISSKKDKRKDPHCDTLLSNSRKTKRESWHNKKKQFITYKEFSIR